MSLAEFMRSGLDVQGFKLSQEEKHKLALPIRFAPALCVALTSIFTFMEWPLGLYFVAAAAFGGSVLPKHPFDYLYMVTLNPILKTGVSPGVTPQRRFACTVAGSMIAGAGLAFALGAPTWGYVLGYGFAIVALPMATLNFCIASWMYNFIPFMPHRYTQSDAGQSAGRAA
jgi:hypothetical protein